MSLCLYSILTTGKPLVQEMHRKWGLLLITYAQRVCVCVCVGGGGGKCLAYFYRVVYAKRGAVGPGSMYILAQN